VCHNPPCGITFFRYASQVRDPDRVYCSITCRGSGESLRQRGEENRNFRHGAYVDPLNRTAKLSEDEIFSICDKDRRKAVRRAFYRLNPEGYVCFGCGLGPFWNNTPLTLDLDHANGDPNDNRLENLRWMCPNCHSQTDTFKSRNPRYRKRQGGDALCLR
jgi:hypothetical protein